MARFGFMIRVVYDTGNRDDGRPIPMEDTHTFQPTLREGVTKAIEYMGGKVEQIRLTDHYELHD